MNRKLMTAALAAAMVFTMACSFVSGLIGGGAAGTVNDLWPDVPPFAGATKANLQLPLPAQIGLNAVLQGKFNFIAYTSKAQPADIANFYSKQKMQSGGWGSDSPGCSLSTSDGANNGAVCVFTKQQGSKNIALAIFVAKEDATKDSQIFYARVEDDGTPTPRR